MNEEAIRKLLRDVKVRIAFIGMPTEPMNEAGPDWSVEVKQIEQALALLRDEPNPDALRIMGANCTEMPDYCCKWPCCL